MLLNSSLLICYNPPAKLWANVIPTRSLYPTKSRISILYKTCYFFTWNPLSTNGKRHTKMLHFLFEPIKRQSRRAITILQWNRAISIHSCSWLHNFAIVIIYRWKTKVQHLISGCSVWTIRRVVTACHERHWDLFLHIIGDVTMMPKTTVMIVGRLVSDHVPIQGDGGWYE